MTLTSIEAYKKAVVICPEFSTNHHSFTRIVHMWDIAYYMGLTTPEQIRQLDYDLRHENGWHFFSSYDQHLYPDFYEYTRYREAVAYKQVKHSQRGMWVIIKIMREHRIKDPLVKHD